MMYNIILKDNHVARKVEFRFVVIFLLFLLQWTSTILALPPQPGDLFELPIIHINDFHARFEETSLQSRACKPQMDNCIGGFSRLYTAVTTLKKQHPDALFLNAGDNFQGSTLYKVHKWNITQYFMNMLPADAYTLGNHEFDNGIDGLLPYMKSLNAPIVVSNIDDSDEPDFQESYQKSTIINRGNKKIGLIGVITKSANESLMTGNLRFLDEAESVKIEAESLKKVHKCDIIIVLSHCGLETERNIAKKGGPYINIIVGGHSHTFLYHGPNLPGPENPADDYPIVIFQDNGNPVLVVQASCFSKYLGFLTVYFDSQNKITTWHGNPIYLDGQIPKDPNIDQLLLPWKDDVDKVGTKVIGETKVLLDRSDCSSKDCNIGNFVTDAMVHSWIIKAGPDEWSFAACAIINDRAIRNGIDIGNITYSDLLTALPYENVMDVVELRGDHLLQTLEHAFSETWGTKIDIAFSHMVQIAGIHLVVNRTLPAGNRIQSVRIRCAKCEVPHYEPLDLKAHYKLVVNDFLGDGGSGFSMIPEHMTKHYHGRRDVDVLMDYITRQSPITQERDDRIQVVV